MPRMSKYAQPHTCLECIAPASARARDPMTRAFRIVHASGPPVALTLALVSGCGVALDSRPAVASVGASGWPTIHAAQRSAERSRRVETDSTVQAQPGSDISAAVATGQAQFDAGLTTLIIGAVYAGKVRRAPGPKHARLSGFQLGFDARGRPNASLGFDF